MPLDKVVAPFAQQHLRCQRGTMGRGCWGHICVGEVLHSEFTACAAPGCFWSLLWRFWSRPERAIGKCSQNAATHMEWTWSSRESLLLLVVLADLAFFPLRVRISSHKEPQHFSATIHFKYLRVVLTSDRRRNKEIDTWIGEANAVLRELYRSVVTKCELSNTAKLSVFRAGLCYDPHLWSWILDTMTERVLSQIYKKLRWGFCE